MANNIFSELLSLSKDLAPWQNEAIRRLFAKRALAQTDKDEIFDLALVEHGLKKAASPLGDLMLKNADLPPPPVPGQKLALVGVRDLKNVNALKDGQRLPIGKQLTVIYGHNASGKSGYARVMKKAFHARVVDDILPNVYASAKTGLASAIFEIEESGKARDEKWIDGSPSPSGLSRFAVFDSKCARIYITGSNELSFLPYGFDIISGLGDITAEVKKRLQDRATQHAPKPDALSHLVDITATGKFIGAISTRTSEDDVKKRAEWTGENADTLKAKEQELSQLRANSPQVLRASLNAQKKRLETIKTSVSTILNGISAARVTEIKGKIAELQKCEQAVEVAAKAAFSGLEMNGVGGDVWRELLLAAEKYSTQVAYPGQSFPADQDDAKCVLCLQPLDASARLRLEGFWKFIQDDVSSKRDVAARNVEVERETLAKLPHGMPKEIEVLEDEVKTSGSKVFEELKVFFPAATSRLTAIEEAVKSREWGELPGEPTSLVPACDAEITAVGERLKGIADDAKVTEQIRLLEAEIAELKARLKLHQNLPTVLCYLDNLKLAGAEKLAADKITTNKIALKAGELQQRLVTDAFKTQVLNNLKDIGLDRARLGVERQPGGKGKVLHKVTIEGATLGNPEAVFSEGERTAISLACFLAELSANDDNCGIILDDPVTSLDHRIRGGVVRLLVKEAKTRQVVIFTHDLVFLRDLWEEADADLQGTEISPQNIEALGNATGIVTRYLPWSGSKVAQRVHHLDKLLADAKAAETAGNPDDYRKLKREYYVLLRSTWERSVEEILFNKVLQRLENEIKTQSLTRVRVDFESVESVFAGMTRASSIIDAHDHAVAANTSLPTIKEMTADLEAFKEFLKSQKDKAEKAEQQHAHLKKNTKSAHLVGGS
jgi:energy-coupling factor transporter ATP-binding protein EcfA2